MTTSGKPAGKPSEPSGDRGPPSPPGGTEVVWDKPSRMSAALAALGMRARLESDKVLHRAPYGARTVGKPAEVARALLGLEAADFERLWAEAVASRLEEEIEAQLNSRFGPEVQGRLIARPGQRSDSWVDVLRFIFVAMRAMKPEAVVETGVGPVGSTTTFILGALAANGRGHLWSVDADRYGSLAGIKIGSGVPERLKDRHTLIRGSAGRSLPRLMQELREVNIFLHDSDHTYANVSREFRTAWPHLPGGSLLIADDCFNSAVDKFSALHRARPVFLAYGRNQMGFFRKPLGATA